MRELMAGNNVDADLRRPALGDRPRVRFNFAYLIASRPESGHEACAAPLAGVVVAQQRGDIASQHTYSGYHNA